MTFMAYFFDYIFCYLVLVTSSSPAETELLACFNAAFFVVSVVEPDIISMIYLKFNPVRLCYSFIYMIGYQGFCTYSTLYQIIVD